ncbi:MAG: CHASE3 domain-containing protein [Fimbriimonadaceae bacterium]|nr:CHASE3 domain-containing protein [Chitinophagales bacterium]
MQLFKISKIGQITSSILIAIIIIIAISAVSFYFNRNFEKYSQEVQDTYEVLMGLEIYMQQITNAESNARGYWLTSDKNFLHNYNSSRLSAYEYFNKLKLLTSDDTLHQQNLSSLSEKSNIRFEFIEKNITLFDTMLDYEAKAFAINVGVRNGAIYMDSIRQIINVMEDKEQELLDSRLTNFSAASKSSIIFIIISAILALIIILLGYFTLRREYFDKVESEVKFKTIFNESEDIIFITNNKLKFTDVNLVAVKLLGFSRIELLSKKLTDLFAEERAKKAVESAMNFNQSINDYEVRILKKDNSRISVLLNLSAQKANVNIKQGSMIDLTERISEEKIKRNLQLFASTGRIARIIGHEVRNPLTNIKMSLEQLKDDGNTNSEDKNMYYDIIDRNSERITQLVTQLLESTKFTELIRKPVLIVKLLDETFKIANDRIQLKKIKFVKEYDRAGDCSIFVDDEKIKIALLNIIINAIEAMEIDNGVLHVDVYTNKTDCIITISDNGIGIPEQNLNKLFEPYFTSKPKGTGLGLTTAHSIILNHKGNIKVESSVGKGTTFIISLPSVPDEFKDVDIEIDT